MLFRNLYFICYFHFMMYRYFRSSWFVLLRTMTAIETFHRFTLQKCRLEPTWSTRCPLLSRLALYAMPYLCLTQCLIHGSLLPSLPMLVPKWATRPLILSVSFSVPWTPSSYLHYTFEPRWSTRYSSLSGHAFNLPGPTAHQDPRSKLT